MGLGKVNSDVERGWKKQVIRDTMDWAKVHTDKHTEKELECFEIGIGRGWDECIKTLKLQGILKVH